MTGAAELERALQTHSVRGYPAQATPFGDVVLESSVSVRNGVYYRVRPEEPMPFDRLASFLSLDDMPKGKREWERTSPEAWPEGEGGQGLSLRSPQIVLPPEIQARLDAGERISWKDVIETWVARGGCLNEKREVTCYDVNGEEVILRTDKIQPGMLVEFFDEKLKKWGWAGRVVKVDGEGRTLTIYVEVFEPVPWMDSPDAMDAEKIQPGFFSSMTWKLGPGTAEAWQKSKLPMPPGEWLPSTTGRGRHEYLTKEPVPIEAVREMCERFHPGEAACVTQSLMLYILPIKPVADMPEHRGGYFRPIPEGAARSGVYLVWRADSPEMS